MADHYDGSMGALLTKGWLCQQDETLRDFVRQNAVWRFYKAGTLIYDAGDPADGLYGIEQGRVEVAFPQLSEEPVALARVSEGFWIGDLALLAQEARLVSLRALDDTRALFVPAGAVARLVKDHPHHIAALYALSYANVRSLLMLLSEILSLPTHVRVARRLLGMAGTSGRVTVSQHDLARLLGVTRSTVQRSLSELSAGGLIAVRYNGIEILDVPGLQEAGDLPRSLEVNRALDPSSGVPTAH